MNRQNGKMSDSNKNELEILKNKIKFEDPIDPDIFNTVAEEVAVKISSEGDRNKSTQIRKFYDELVSFYQRIDMDKNPDEKFNKLLPFIKMMNAKIAYAKGRKLVGMNFESIFRHSINEIKDKESLKHCKLFMEAVIGFRKSKEKMERAI